MLTHEQDGKIEFIERHADVWNPSTSEASSQEALALV
jgi:hypothetical protein